MELADTSVWTRRRHPQIVSWFEQAAQRGEIALCDMVALEILAGTRREDYSDMAYRLRRSMPWLQMDSADWARALEVQAALARAASQLYRRVKASDLLIAAVAERHGVTLVHYDQDYDAIANLTGQSMRWAAVRGGAG
jgi:predicted nucleic acid-binding protein